MNIFVGNLSKDVTDDEIQTLFAEHGKVKSVKIIRDLFSGESKGFGFVEMFSNTEAQAAIGALNIKEIKGKRITVNEARPKTDSRSGGHKRGGGMNRSGGRRY